jgi:hypothetical protein
MPTYEVTCTFDGPGCGTPGGAINRSLNSVSSMREEGLDISHREVVISGDENGAASEMNARFSAPNEGIVGWHVWRARLPACGIRPVD